MFCVVEFVVSPASTYIYSLIIYIGPVYTALIFVNNVPPKRLGCAGVSPAPRAQQHAGRSSKRCRYRRRRVDARFYSIFEEDASSISTTTYGNVAMEGH